ncbi:MAG: TolC family protein [Saprospiraceae bacterium]|nr:TolC family protein [Saprospiraceae bacterium]
MLRTFKVSIVFICFLICPLLSGLHAQVALPDSLLGEVTLAEAIEYAIQRHPEIRKTQLDEKITNTRIRSILADWYPQLNFDFNFQHNLILPASVIGGNTVRFGTNNNSAGQLTATQNIFDRDILLARRTSQDVQKLAGQNTSNNKIDLAVNVSKAFYDVLLTVQQIKVAESNITRIERSLKDAYNQYSAGIVDKIDYKRATITLNNSLASKKSNEDLLVSKLEWLKALMNYPEKATLQIVFDSLQMENEIVLDTLQLPDYRSRIEYSQLLTQRSLLVSNLDYNKWAYLPTVSAFGAYNLNFLNNNLGELYSRLYPNLFLGLRVGLPLYQGGRRKSNISIAEMELQRNELDISNFQIAVRAEYAEALAIYKRNHTSYLTLKENMKLAEEVYDVIQLQYRSGVKTYLEVITSETDLRAAQINYYNAVFQLLASKIDVQKSLGQINY